MVNQEKLVAWIGGLRPNIKLFEVTGVRTLLEQISDFHCELTVNGQSFVGRGTDWGADLALTKAVAEAVERACAYGSGLTSSIGCAAHFELDAAKQNARLEVLEHYLIAKKIMQEEPFALIDSSQLRPRLDRRWIECLRRLGRHKVEIKVLQVLDSVSLKTILILMLGQRCSKPFGVFMGVGTGINYEYAFKKALIEALRKTSHWFKSSEKWISLQEFITLPFAKELDRQRLGANPNYGPAFVEKYFSIKENAQMEDRIPQLQFEYTKLDCRELADTPFVIVNANTKEFSPITLDDPYPF